MKTKIFKRMKRAASALLTALIICSVFSLFVVYYLSLIEQQNLLNTRSQTWNMAIAITEAGVEEGLEHLNENTANLGLAPWSFLGGNTYYRSNTLPDGNSYTVFITNTLPNPIVVARAYVQANGISIAQNSSIGFFAAGGISTAPTTVTRAVRVNCTKNSLFLYPLMAKKTINLNGNNISTDSYSSCDLTKSRNGQYDPTVYVGDNGDIASNLGIVDAISGGNANIYGHAHTGTNSSAGSITLGPNGAIGSHTWQASNKGIEPGWAMYDANFTFPDTTFPNTGMYSSPTGGVLVVSNLTSVTTPYSPNPGTYVGTITTSKSHGITSYTYNVLAPQTNNYDTILWGTTDINNTNCYTVNSLSGQTIIIGDNVVLALPNGLNMSGSDSITVMPAAYVVGAPTSCPPGANVQVYCGGTSCAIGGNGVINQPGLPIDFILYCAPTVTTFSLSGNAGFTGILVAPTVDLTLNGGGSTPTDFIGCAMVNSATLNGHFKFHYDECLSNYKNSPRFLITAWNEIP